MLPCTKLLLIHNYRGVMCLVTQSCATHYDPTDNSPPGSSVCGDSPWQVLEWVVALL